MNSSGVFISLFLVLSLAFVATTNAAAKGPTKAPTHAPTPTPLPQPQCVNSALSCVSDLKTPYKEGCYFGVTHDSAGKYWFVDPNGRAFWSKGVVNVDNKGIAGDQNGTYARTIEANYPNTTYWAQVQGERMKCWGLNSIGPWSAKETSSIGVPYTILLSFSNDWGMLAPNASAFASGAMAFPDIYDPGFVPFVQQTALAMCAPAINDPYLLGYYLDNEILWGAGNGSAWKSILAIYLNYTGIPGNLKAQEFLIGKYNTIGALNAAWKINASSFATIDLFWPYLPNTKDMISDCYTFTLNTIDYYFNVTTTAVRFQDPNHLILGTKDIGGAKTPPNTVLIPTGRWCDVYSLDYYTDLPNATELGTIWTEANIPVLIAEMSFRANDTGLGNDNGNPLTKVANQSVRADSWQAYAQAAAAFPYVVGLHWYMWFDQPPKCDDPNTCKDSNLGLVNGTDDVYVILTNRMAQYFPTLDAEHGNSCANFTAKCFTKRACPGNCNGNGCCNKATGMCMCDTYHTQLDCSGYIGPFIDNFYSLNTSRWVVADQDNAQTFYLEQSRITTGPSGATIYLNSTGCPSKCYGLSYATTSLTSVQPYRAGTFQANIKTTNDINSLVSIAWVTPYADNTKEGIYLFLMPNGTGSNLKVVVYQAGTQSFSHNYVLSYDPSYNFSTISITRNSTNAYIVYVGSSTTPLVSVPSTVSAGGVYEIGFSPQSGNPSHADELFIKSISFVPPTFAKGSCARNDPDCDCEYEDSSDSPSNFTSSSTTDGSSSTSSPSSSSSGTSTGDSSSTSASSPSSSTSAPTSSPSSSLSSSSTTASHQNAGTRITCNFILLLLLALSLLCICTLN